MGKQFKYVADEALTSLEDDSECQHCGKSDVTVYDFQGEIINPELSAAPEIAKEEPEIYYACKTCIESGNLIPDDFHEDEIKRASPTSLHSVIESKEFRCKPYVMFLQGPQWPYCCDDMTEYLGEVPNKGDNYSQYKCWEPMSPAVSNHQLADFYPLDKLEVLYSMNLFKCQHCQTKYWNFQYSGLFWPGPVK